PEPRRSHDPVDESRPPDGQGPRPRRLLPRGRAKRRTGSAPAARLPDQLADVPQPYPGPGRPVPRARPRLPRLRPQLDATSARVRLHLRQPRRRRRGVQRDSRPVEVRPVRARLRRAGRLPARLPPPGARDGHRGAKRQRLRRGTGQRLLEAAQGVLAGTPPTPERGRPTGPSSSWRHPPARPPTPPTDPAASRGP